MSDPEPIAELRSYVNHEFLTSEGVRAWNTDELNASLDLLSELVRAAQVMRKWAGCFCFIYEDGVSSPLTAAGDKEHAATCTWEADLAFYDRALLPFETSTEDTP